MSAAVIRKAIDEAADVGRRHGEQWAEIAIANYLREAVAALPDGAVDASGVALLRDLADRIEAGTWRRPEMRSIVDDDERL